MTTTTARDPGVIASLNTKWHRLALTVFLLIVIAHMAEHLAQAIQIYVLGWPAPEARGVLGIPFPWLISSEAMHYGYALLMLIGLLLLRTGFKGHARTWWNVALGIQIWHHFEHLLLLLQAQTGMYLLGREVPTSIIQLLVPRVELHLFYNTIVFIPMIVAMVLHRRVDEATRAEAICTCAYARA